MPRLLRRLGPAFFLAHRGAPTVAPSVARRVSFLIVAAMVLAACSAAGSQATVSFDPNAPAITASGDKFDKAELDVPSGQGFELVLHNQDTDPHNVSIYADEGHTQRIFGGDVDQHGDHVYTIQALQPGTYYFRCDVHPSMNGIVVAGQG